MIRLMPNRQFVIGFLTGVMALLAVAWFWVLKVNRHEEDPLTGRNRYTTEWLGAIIHTRVAENDVSRWVDQHSIRGIYPGQYGWSPVTTSHRRWFGPTSIGCGGSGVPLWIFRGEIRADGLSKEELLQKYQTELIDNWKRTQSFLPVMQEWAKRAQVKPPPKAQVEATGLQ